MPIIFWFNLFSEILTNITLDFLADLKATKYHFGSNWPLSPPRFFSSPRCVKVFVIRCQMHSMSCWTELCMVQSCLLTISCLVTTKILSSGLALAVDAGVNSNVRCFVSTDFDNFTIHKLGLFEFLEASN